MTSYPFWLTASDLGTVPDQTSLTLSAVTLSFGESNNVDCVVSLLNGELPPGISWQQQGFSVELTGVVSADNQSDRYEFTLRVSNGTKVADRTYSISVSATISSFDWLSDPDLPVLYAYNSQQHTGVIQAVSVPSAPVTYSITNLISITQGVSINSVTGGVNANLGWLPNTDYVSNRDAVYSNNGLYTCVVSGRSASSRAPSGVGTQIVDSDSLSWQSSRLYLINDTATNNLGRLYVCVRSGLSAASGGPTGMGTNIADNTVLWNYVGQAPVWSSVTANTALTVNLNCAADIPGSTITEVFNIQLLSTPHAPVWITPAGLLSQVAPQQIWSAQLDVFDPDGVALMFSSSDLPSWLNISNVGLLWGSTPAVTSITDYSWTVTVTDGTQSSSRTFELQVLGTQAVLSWITQPDLGSMVDGQPCAVQVQAVSAISYASVSYGLSGGMLPPRVSVNPNSGVLQGFVDYHAEPKNYAFEITATDGVQTIVRLFTLGVVSSDLGHFCSISVPLLGPDRRRFINNNNDSVVNSAQLYLSDDAGWGRVDRPRVVLISGVRVTNLVSLRESISNWLHSFTITLADARTQQASNGEFNQVYLAGRDSHSLMIWQPLVAYSQGSVVSTADGSKYVAVSSGTSSSAPPQGNSNSISDGSVIWSWLSQPLNVIDTVYALPWYAHHFYPTGSTVVNQGQAYVCVQSGFSDGNHGPRGEGVITDGQTVWQSIQQQLSAPAPNQFWPSSVYNIRRTLINSLGWSTAQGTAASAQPVILSSTGAIQSVTVNAGGEHYHTAPLINVVGTGTGAVLMAELAVMQVTVIRSSDGFSVGNTVTVDLHSAQPVVLTVTAVDNLGRVTALSVVQGGSFERVPSSVITVPTAQGEISMLLNPGVSKVLVVQPGSGYDALTTINFDGREWDASMAEHSDQFVLKCVLAYTQPDVLPVVRSNPFLDQNVDASMVAVSVEGIQWQGRTRWDENTCTFDGNSTRFVEHTTANTTTFDNSLTVWEDSHTTWDSPLPTRWPNVSNTVFDQGHTIFDYYRTVWDAAPTELTSHTAVHQIWHMGAPQQ